MSASPNGLAVYPAEEAEWFNLQVVSPSAGVNEPLLLPKLSARTTVKQLKEKIREALPMRPPDNHQRLIYQGRLLARGTDTMLEILGQDKLRNIDTQTLHLVLRPPISAATVTLNGSALPNQYGNVLNSSLLRSLGREPPPPPPVSPEFLRHGNSHREREGVQESTTSQHPEIPHAGAIRLPTPPAFPASVPPPPATVNGLPSSQSATDQPNELVIQPADRYSPQIARSPDPTAEQARRVVHAHHHHNQIQQPAHVMQLIVRLLQQDHERLQRERERSAQQLPVRNVPGGAPQPVPGHPEGPTFPELVAQNQRNRAAMGMHGAQQGNGSHNNSQFPAPYILPPGFNLQRLPHQTRTMTHGLSGPNGERWQVTVNETLTFPQLSRVPNNNAQPIVGVPMAREVQDLAQNIIRAGNGAPDPPQSRQSPGDSQQADRHLNAGINVPTNRPASAPPSGNSDRIITTVTSPITIPEQLTSGTGASVNARTLAGPEVYILSSPTGPQALLINPVENGLEAFLTPSNRSTSFSRPDNQHRQDGAIPNTQGATERRIHRREARAHRQARHQDGANVRPALPARQINPQAGGVAIQLWPHIWLITRLIIFVWFFATGENRSWYQFITVTGLAVIVFIASTGIFNGIADQIWAPFRRHLEGLVPLAAPNIADRALPNANADAAAPRQVVETPAGGGAPEPAVANPHPAEAAARLIEQRRRLNEGWPLTLLRRAEHAMLLFLASLIPGVGERHIAARAAEENLLLEADRLRREVGDAAERVVAVEEQLRAAMGEMINVAADVAAINTPDARARQNAEEGSSETREPAENEEGDGGDNAAVGPAHQNVSPQTREEAAEQPLVET